MCPDVIRSLMITNLGRACGRVRYNIEYYSPTTIIYFHQEDPGWNETNEAYKNALNKFNLHPKIQEYHQKGKLIPEEVSSITKYIDFFDKLADLVEKNKDKYEIIYLDCTGLPKLATVVALHLSGMYKNVYPIYNQNKVTIRYEIKRDSEYSSDEGKGPEPLPFTRIDTSWISKPESSDCQLLRAVCSMVEQSDEPLDVRFSRNDLKDELSKLDMPLTPIKLGKALKKMLDSGLIMEDLTVPRRFKLTMPGYALARRILKEHRKVKPRGKADETGRSGATGVKKGR